MDYHDAGGHIAELLWSLVAFTGGVAKYLYEMNKNKSPFKLFELLAKAFVSGFSGWTAAHVAMSMNLGPDTILSIAAVSGWLGADMIEIIWKYLQKKYFS